MRVMVLIKATPDSEAGKMPSEKLLAGMMQYNEALVNAGVMVAGDGLHPSARAKRVQFKPGQKPTVIDGPFAETKELIAGFWIWKVDSLDDAARWVQKMADYVGDSAHEDSTVEIRQIFEPDDFGDELTPELRAKEQELRARSERPA